MKPSRYNRHANAQANFVKPSTVGPFSISAIFIMTAARHHLITD